MAPYCHFAPQHLTKLEGEPTGATHGAPRAAARAVYRVGPTDVSGWTCTPGSFPNPASCPGSLGGPGAFFHVLEGVFFLTDADGSARRCVGGDTVVLPGGWAGHWDVIEPVRCLRVLVY